MASAIETFTLQSCRSLPQLVTCKTKVISFNKCSVSVETHIKKWHQRDDTRSHAATNPCLPDCAEPLKSQSPLQ